ncbi:MAG: 4Fe-4S binding protein [Candidatus Methanomethylophilaceae archaeon]|nr:4Fe-4S binding protein [Candidatus Methanomethylophilaceae archaeon]
MIRKSLSNLVSSKRPAESLELMGSRSLMMPFISGECDSCGECAGICPTRAISLSDGWTIDLGKCIFCMDCADSCPRSSIVKVPAPLYALSREDLVFSGSKPPKESERTVDAEKVKVLGPSMAIRELDTGSCNACEVEVNCMSNPYYDMGRFGIKIVASPRHADMLLVTGPMTNNMSRAALETFEATPAPKAVVAMGTCAISGGIFVEGDVLGKGIKDTMAVDLFIPGCPPPPERVLLAILKAFGRDQ